MTVSSRPSVPKSIRPDQRDKSPIDAIIGSVFATERATGIDDPHVSVKATFMDECATTLMDFQDSHAYSYSIPIDTRALLTSTDKPSGP